jgi:hypothetical protein
MFEEALSVVHPEAARVDRATGPGGAYEYRRFEVASPMFGKDYVE